MSILSTCSLFLLPAEPDFPRNLASEACWEGYSPLAHVIIKHNSLFFIIFPQLASASFSDRSQPWKNAGLMLEGKGSIFWIVLISEQSELHQHTGCPRQRGKTHITPGFLGHFDSVWKKWGQKEEKLGDLGMQNLCCSSSMKQKLYPLEKMFSVISGRPENALYDIWNKSHGPRPLVILIFLSGTKQPWW